MRALLLSVALALPIAGCGAKDHPSGPPCLTTSFHVRRTSAISDAVDILVVRDTARGSADEQDALAASVPGLLRELTDPADHNADGQPDWAPVGDVHLAVISMDMGTEGLAVTGCEPRDGGDDGVFFTDGCFGPGPTYLSFQEGDDIEAFAEQCGCRLNADEEGCGFRRPFDASLRALVDHAEGPNDGFLRDNSLLLVLFVTDRDDCSVRADLPDARSLYDVGAPLGPLNLRCATHEATHLAAVEAVARELVALRAATPERLVVAALTGAPLDSSCAFEDGGPEGFACLLADPAMQTVVDESGEHLVPSCEGPSGDAAVPPRRIVGLLQQVSAAGAGTVLRSSCAASFDDAMVGLAETLQPRVSPSCLSRDMPADDVGGTQCFIEEQMASPDPCGPGRIDRGVGDHGRVCRICQRGDGDERTVDAEGVDVSGCAGTTVAGDYWAWSSSPSCPTRGDIHFRGRSVPQLGSVVTAGCVVSDC
jgi:hypothetical protein